MLRKYKNKEIKTENLQILKNICKNKKESKGKKI